MAQLAGVATLKERKDPSVFLYHMLIKDIYLYWQDDRIFSPNRISIREPVVSHTSVAKPFSKDTREELNGLEEEEEEELISMKRLSISYVIRFEVA